MAIELKNLQEMVAIDLERMATQMRNKATPEWNSQLFDYPVVQKQIKWLKRFDNKMGHSSREFYRLFLKLRIL